MPHLECSSLSRREWNSAKRKRIDHSDNVAHDVAVLVRLIQYEICKAPKKSQSGMP